MEKSLQPGDILRKAFGYWSSTLSFQLLFSLIYFVLFYAVSFFIFRQLNLMEPLREISALLTTDTAAFQQRLQELAQTENYRLAALLGVAASAIAFPLNIGLLFIYQKIDKGERPRAGDLFKGYEGRNFFLFFGFYLFWGIINFYAKMFVLPSVIWVLFTLLCSPLLFFGNMRLNAAVAASARAFMLHPFLFVVCALAAVVISYVGILLFGVGLLFTFPFWNAVIYVLYNEVTVKTMATS
ncbi:MAG: hypothetical protein EAS48_05835 [Chryseobacterium sp.]|nr:MAG: hypothetical protein EAS48_05835 [Chryseobacterium sp.]